MNSRPRNQSDNPEPQLEHDCAFALDHIESFALDALDSFDRGIVEHHLRWCESCRSEAAAFERVVGIMHLTTPMGPAPLASSRRDLFSRIAGSDNAAMPSRPVSRQVERPAVSRVPAHGWWRNVPMAIIAPMAVALVVVGVWANSMRSDLATQNREQVSQSQINQSLASGGAVRMFSVEQSCPTCQGNGQVGVSESNGMGMVVGHDFNPAQQHDVWGVNDKGETKKFCELEIDETGAVMQMFTVPDASSTFMDVYITDEDGELIYVSHLSGPANDSTPYQRETPLPTT